VTYNFNNNNERNYFYKFSLQTKDQLNDAYFVCDLKLKLRNVKNNRHFLNSFVFIKNLKSLNNESLH